MSDNRFSQAFEAPGYRWLWLYSLFGSVAFAVELLSQGWLVLVLTNSPLWVGIAAGLRGISQALFSILGGPAVDRGDRRKILLITQLMAALAALALALLLVRHAARLWHVLIYFVIVGLIIAVSKISSSGLMYELVGAPRLMNASAFQFMAASCVRIVGAVAGGFIIDRLGVGGNYFLISGAYLAGAAALLRLKAPVRPARAAEPFAHALRAGLRYAVGDLRIRRLLSLSQIMEAFGFVYTTMMPVMARDVLRVGGSGLGYLTAMIGVGQLGATLLVASRGDVPKKGTVLVTAAFLFGACVSLFGLSPWFLASLIIVAVAGAVGITYDTTMSTTLMLAASDENRGRVLGLYYATMGFSAFGWFGIGILATALGMPAALAISGAIVAVNAVRLLPGLHTLHPPEHSNTAAETETSPSPG